MHVNEHLYKIQNANKPDYSNVANLHPQSLGRCRQKHILKYTYKFHIGKEIPQTKTFKK